MKFHLLLISLLISISMFAQNTDNYLKGSISFKSSQHVYVQFVNTEGIQAGDTLSQIQNNKLEPILVVSDLSTISCICNNLTNRTLALSSEVLARKKADQTIHEVVVQSSKEAIAVTDEAITKITDKKEVKTEKPTISGRLSVSSYSMVSNDSNVDPYQRLRYNFSMTATRIANTNLSAETYMTFTQKLGETAAFYDAFKVYNLALNYDISKTAKVSLGRKINPSMANIGAVDGLQFENKGKNFSYGALVGSRPNNYNYSFDPSLMQFGAFIGHQIKKEDGFMQTSVGFFNQTNNWITDRRFAYIQHSNSLLKNLDFFGSMEIDLYGKVNNQLTTKIDLTSTYLSLRYRPWRKLSMSLTYDARKNIYYYETFKSYVDSVLDKETRQGFRLQANYRPFNKLVWGGTGGFRMATATSASSLNGNSYLTYTQLPLIDASLTVDATILKSDYLDGMIYGATISRDFISGKLFAELSYRYVDYTFTRTTSTLQQNIAEISVSWRLAKKLTLSANFEGAMDTNNNLDGRLFINISQRF